VVSSVLSSVLSAWTWVPGSLDRWARYWGQGNQEILSEESMDPCKYHRTSCMVVALVLLSLAGFGRGRMGVV
jgi:hypothetical protein